MPCTSQVLPLPPADLLPHTEPLLQLSPKGAAGRFRRLQDKPFICGCGWHAFATATTKPGIDPSGSTWYRPGVQAVLETEVKVPSQGQLALKYYKRVSMSIVTSVFPSFNRTKHTAEMPPGFINAAGHTGEWMHTKPIFISAAHLITAAKHLRAATLELGF